MVSFLVYTKEVAVQAASQTCYCRKRGARVPCLSLSQVRMWYLASRWTDAPRLAWPSFVRTQGAWLALVQAHQDRAFSGRAQDIDLEARLKREGGIGQGGEGSCLDPGRERSHIGRPLVLSTQHLQLAANVMRCI